MAAVFAALACQLSAGDRVVAARELFGSCHFIVAKLLPRWGVEVELVKGTDLDAWEKALSRPATVTFLESRSEEHTSELQSLMRISYAVFCLKKKTKSHKQC